MIQIGDGGYRVKEIDAAGNETKQRLPRSRRRHRQRLHNQMGPATARV